MSPAPQAIKVVEPPEQENPCGPNRYRSNHDLCAQWKAADAARDAATWARWQLWLGIAGAVGLLLSIYYTRRAVLAAVASNKNAQEALAHAKEMAEVELRPYLQVDEIAFQAADTLSGQRPVTVRIKNFGSTPAMQFRVEAGVELRNTVKIDPLKGVRTRRIPSVDEIPPGHSAVIRIDGVPQGAFLNQSCDFFCTVRFRYSDKFGANHARWETYRAGSPTGRGEFRFFSHNHS